MWLGHLLFCKLAIKIIIVLLLVAVCVKMVSLSSISIVFSLVCLTAYAQLSWTEIEAGGELPGARSGAHLVFDRYSDSLYMFGGGVDNYMWRFDLATGNWSIDNNSSGLAPPGRKFAYFGLIRYGGITTGDSLFVISHGFGSSEFDDTWVYNIRTKVWAEVSSTGPKPSIRYGGHFGVFNNTVEFWMGGGFTLTTTLATRYIDTYILKFTGETEGNWVRVHDQPSIGNQFDPLAPHGRCLQGSAVVEEDKIVLWGGCMRYCICICM